jgi:hypothetical protein
MYEKRALGRVFAYKKKKKKKKKKQLQNLYPSPNIYWMIIKSCPCAQRIKHYAMKAYGGMDVSINIFLTSALAGGEWSASRPGRFTPGDRAPGTHWIGGWVDPRTSLDDLEK